MRKITNKLIFLSPLILLSIAIVVVSNQEQIIFLNDGFLFEDKLLHFIAYFVYGLTLQFAFATTTNMKTKKIFLIVVLFGALFAMTDEIHQHFVKGRSSDIFDWIADTLGIISSLLLRNIVFKVKQLIEKH